VLFEPGADGVEIVADPALVGVIVEACTDHRCAHPELIGMEPEFVQEGDHGSHGSNASSDNIPPTVAALTP
jgi:hypothetical protein